jgi:hypothetical protein
MIGVIFMKLTSPNTTDNNLFKDTYLFQMLDSGICDMEAGKELPLADAFQKISELRECRRNARL